MENIVGADKGVLSILRKPKQKDAPQRLIHYCVEQKVEEGMLLHNLLTREMVLLTEAEYEKQAELEYLKDHWFLVPEGTRDQEYVDLVKWVLSARQKKSEYITGYTIFPTTDCNARCFYCFELGRSRIPMRRETALKTVQYIQNHCGGKKVSISWFGGEPLFNREAIDTICDGLRAEGIAFKSTMVSNGYLFDDDVVKTAVEQWNLKSVQITLDGTEAVYNKAKAYIYREGSPYQVVLENIGRLLDAQVVVNVRMNMDLYNAADLMKLVEELAERFAGKKGLRAYAHHLFEGNKPMAGSHSEEGWNARDAAMRLLEEKLEQCGLALKVGISKAVKMNHCMADSGKSVTILPDGNIGLCEHFSEDEFIGNLDRKGFDEAVVASWKETATQIPECAECFYYPECIMLKKCANACVCFRQLREERLRKTKRRMMNEYDRWKSNSQSEELEETGDC